MQIADASNKKERRTEKWNKIRKGKKLEREKKKAKTISNRIVSYQNGEIL